MNYELRSIAVISGDRSITLWYAIRLGSQVSPLFNTYSAISEWLEHQVIADRRADALYEPVA